MKFSALSMLALPLLGATAEEAPFAQYQAQFQNYLDKASSYIPIPNRHDHAAAAAAKADKNLHILTISNFKDTLYAPVLAKFQGREGDAPQLSAIEPEPWLVLVSGRNKTCRGRCGQVEHAFNETAAKYATLPTSPHFGLVNCDDQPILCNVFSVGPAVVWDIRMEWPGNDVDIYHKRLNTTTTTAETLQTLYNDKNREDWLLVDHSFHPFNGWLAKNHLSIPVAWILWAFSILPNWATMILISFASRRMMNRRMNETAGPGGAPPAAAAR